MLHIDGAFAKAMQMSYAKEAANLIPFELTIVDRTKVLDLGMRSSLNNAVACTATVVNFDNITEASGLISNVFFF